MTTSSEKKVYLIDGSGFLYRGYYGSAPLQTSEGISTQAVFAFCQMMKKIIDKFQPQYCAIVWDSKGSTTRHALYPEYKSKRLAPPTDIFLQKDLIKEFADVIEMMQVQQAGFEADDILYSLAQDYAQQGYEVIVISSDKDLAQLLNSSISLYDYFKDIYYTQQSYEEYIGFSIQKLPFYYALIGDTSDNIPGVKGIGPKTAKNLLTQFDSLDELYTNIDQINNERIRALLEEYKQVAYLSQSLFTAVYHPFNVSIDDVAFNPLKWSQAFSFFYRLEFKTLVKKIETKSLIKAYTLADQYQFISVTDKHVLKAICAQILKKGFFALDTELVGPDPLFCTLVGISLCVQPGTAYYIPVGHTQTAEQLELQEVKLLLAPLLENESIIKIMHHAQFDILALLSVGLVTKGALFDTMIAANLVTQDWQSNGLKNLSELYYNEPMLSYEMMVTQAGYTDFSQVPVDKATQYAAADAHQTLKLYHTFQALMTERGVDRLFYTLEMPLVYLLVAMHQQGIRVETSVLRAMDELASKDISLIKEKIIEILGQDYAELNLNSPLQVHKMLYQDLELALPKSNKKTKLSTDVYALSELEHPVARLILEYRELAKLQNTYLQALPTYINSTTHKIHTRFSQIFVRTGRLSSSEPNLQNIPVRSRYAITVRSAFVPDEGYTFISADYSQIELRVLAYLSQDPVLCAAFADNEDIHTQTAAGLFKVSLAEVTQEQRELGKRINFSILYGSTPYGLAQDLGIELQQAKEFINVYFKHYPGVEAWMRSVIEQTRKDGYVTTLLGRRRFVPGIYESNKRLYAEACRIAINTVAQGSAAEIVKMSMLAVDNYIKQHMIDAHMLLQIHDEFLIMVGYNHAQILQTHLPSIMQNVVQWNVPLLVTLRTGHNWHEVTK